MRWITAPVGGWLSGQKSAYRYLAYSAKHFFTPKNEGAAAKSRLFQSGQQAPDGWDFCLDHRGEVISFQGFCSADVRFHHICRLNYCPNL
jgi:hypothetical protein